MTNDSLMDPSAINAGAHDGNASLPDDYDTYAEIYDYIVSHKLMCLNSINIFYDFTVLICILGILGNGMVIWLLGFRIKRNHLTTFILNLAVADFGVLVAAIMHRIKNCSELLYFKNIIFVRFLSYTFLSMFSTSQILLTIVGIDRCVSVFCPHWHRCHRPAKLSTVVCTLTWLIPSITAMTDFIFHPNDNIYPSDIAIYIFIANSFLCLLLMTISGLMLFVKVCCKSRQQRQKFLRSILVTVSFFIFCCFPFSALMMTTYFFGGLYSLLAISSACINSSVKPLIYYLVGKHKELSNKSMKGVLQKLFKEEAI